MSCFCRRWQSGALSPLRYVSHSNSKKLLRSAGAQYKVIVERALLLRAQFDGGGALRAAAVRQGFNLHFVIKIGIIYAN